MIDSYSGGYCKALIDLYELLGAEVIQLPCNSKKKFKTMVMSLLKILIENHDTRESFMETGGKYIQFRQNPKTGEIVDMERYQ